MNSPSPRRQRPFALRLRKWLLAIPITIIALLLILEEWLWDTTQALFRALPEWPFLLRLRQWVSSLSPYAALSLFVAPSLLLFPVKILALLAITHGHPSLGLGIIVAAKVLGTALVARIYALTRPTLLSLRWFERMHNGVLAFKDRMIAYLHATAGWRLAQRVVASIKTSARTLLSQVKSRFAAGTDSKLGRLWRRLAARLKRRRRT